MRLFLAVPLPERLKAELGALQADLRHRGVHAAWTDPASMHLTLVFLGEQDPSQVPRIGALLDSLASRYTAFPLDTVSLGAFPRPTQARILWLGLATEPRLDALVLDLRQELSSLGLAFDLKPFTPHLTLARFRQSTELGEIGGAMVPRSFQAEQVVLYESIQCRGGAQHVERVAVRLTQDPN